jgi:moderate conductance mechanosensitive channel
VEHFADRVASLGPRAALLIAGIVLVFAAAWVARRLARIAARLLARAIAVDSRAKLDAATTHVERFITRTAWLALPVLACVLLAAPARVTNSLVLALSLYLTIAGGLLVIRFVALLVDLIDVLGRRLAERRQWTRSYDHLRALLPTLRASLEYALWVGIVTLVLFLVPSTRPFAIWGPRVLQAIAIFFAGRVLIELAHLEIGHRMLPSEGLSDTDRRRRATMVPLVRSTTTYAVYFGTFALVLSTLGFNVMPFLAGAGILGLVIGFGAQSLINDVVSGFFILFENIYLVGDVVEVGPARGVVEAIEFRTTKIRDSEGRLHIIRNGDMKPVINYSREYTIAVVAVDVAYDADLHRVFATLQQTGALLRAANSDVLADLVVEGITAFGATTMTIRTATRVKAGRHDAVAAALRLLITETFDREAGGVPRKSLIPERNAAAASRPADVVRQSAVGGGGQPRRASQP